MKSLRLVLSVVVLMSLSTVAFAQSDAQKSGGFVGSPRDNRPAASRDRR